jgi:hypothetical protein
MGWNGEGEEIQFILMFFHPGIIQFPADEPGLKIIGVYPGLYDISGGIIVNWNHQSLVGDQPDNFFGNRFLSGLVKIGNGLFAQFD